MNLITARATLNSRTPEQMVELSLYEAVFMLLIASLLSLVF